MKVYIARRLGAFVLLLFGVTVVVFLVIHLIPGDPIMLMMRSSGASPQEMADVRRQLGLDSPLATQYVRWLGQAFRGNFGSSFVYNVPVTQLIAANLPATVELTVAGMLISVLLGLSGGLVAALHKDTMWDTVTMILSLVGLSMPSFWLGLILLLFLGVDLRVFPIVGGTSVAGLVLPAFTLGIGAGGVVARFVRSSVIETLHRQHVATARSKGLSGSAVLWRHVVRNAILPVVTVVGLQLGSLLSGAILVETVFSRPGIGALLVNSILAKDYLMVQALVLLIAGMFAFVNLLVDLTYPFLDPRIAYG